jgi:hypothetical protein
MSYMGSERGESYVADAREAAKSYVFCESMLLRPCWDEHLKTGSVGEKGMLKKK